MIWIIICGVEVADAGGKTVAVDVTGTVVAVDEGAGVAGVTVGGVVVGEPGADVKVGAGVSDSTVVVTVGVSDEMGVGVGVMNIGDPNSLHPRSGAPVNPTIGVGGTSSPFAAMS